MTIDLSSKKCVSVCVCVCVGGGGERVGGGTEGFIIHNPPSIIRRTVSNTIFSPDWCMIAA